MSVHLFVTSKAKINWRQLAKLINLHKPKIVSICYVAIEAPDEIYRTPPIIFDTWVNQHKLEKIEHIESNSDTVFEFDPANILRLDVQMGAAFAIKEVINLLPESLELWSSYYQGSKAIRLDDEGFIESSPIDYLTRLRMDGVDPSMEKPEMVDFDYSILQPTLEYGFATVFVNHDELFPMGELDSNKAKLILKDDAGKSFTIDARHSHGFWLEDLVVQGLLREIAQEKSDAEVFTSIIMNRNNRTFQFKCGLNNIARQSDTRPFIQDEIIKQNELDDWTQFQDIFSDFSVVMEMELEDSIDNYNEFVQKEILDAGAVNEFDAVILSEEEFTVVEVKAAKPALNQLSKLASLIPRSLAPVRKKAILVHGWTPRNNIEKANFEMEINIFSILFPNIAIKNWLDYFPELAPPPLWKQSIDSIKNEIRISMDRSRRWFEANPCLPVRVDTKWELHVQETSAGLYIGKGGSIIRKISQDVPAFMGQVSVVTYSEEE